MGIKLNPSKEVVPSLFGFHNRRERERKGKRERYVSEREKEESVGVKVSGFPHSYKGPDPTRFEHEHSGERRKRKREREGPTNENYERWCQYQSDLFSSLDYALEILTVDKLFYFIFFLLGFAEKDNQLYYSF